MPTGARQIEGYSQISESVLNVASVAKQVCHKIVEGNISKGTQIKVYVNGLSTIADYVPGTGVAISNDGSSYVTLNNLKEKAVNELLDGVTVEKAPADLVVQRFMAAMEAFAEQLDTDVFTKMIADGTTLVAAGAAKPTAATIYANILSLKLALDNAKAPTAGRYLVLTPEMENLLLSVDSKIVLNTVRGDGILANGFVGRLAGFDVFSSVLVPAGTNIIAIQERGFAVTEDFTKEPAIVSLDGSEKFYGDSAIKGRWAYNSGAIRPTLIQLNKGQA